MEKVIAIAKGYYGEKVRMPGETFGIEKKEDFSGLWMAYPDADQRKRDAVQRKASSQGADGEKGTDGVVLTSNPPVEGEGLADIEPNEDQLKAAADAHQKLRDDAEAKADDIAAAKRAQRQAVPKTREPKAKAKGKAK